MKSFILISFLVSLASPSLGHEGSGHTLADCERITHVSHGGVAGHERLGEGKVLWNQWWSQEGVSNDILIADCKTGRTLKLRTHEERVTNRFIPDQTEKALDTIRRHAASGPFFTLERLEAALKGTGRDKEQFVHRKEVCACHVAYPDLRGDKSEYGKQP